MLTPIGSAGASSSSLARRSTQVNEKQEVFYGTQHNPVPPVENDSYVIENDLYVRIWFF
jgi:hypothetical protein